MDMDMGGPCIAGRYMGSCIDPPAIHGAMYRQTDTWLVILEYERFLQPIAVPRSHAVSVVRMLPGSVAMNVLLPALVSLLCYSG